MAKLKPWWCTTVQEAQRESARRPLGCRWVTLEKGDPPRLEVRCRLVVQETRMQSTIHLCANSTIGMFAVDLQSCHGFGSEADFVSLFPVAGPHYNCGVTQNHSSMTITTWNCAFLTSPACNWGQRVPMVWWQSIRVRYGHPPVLSPSYRWRKMEHVDSNRAIDCMSACCWPS